MQWGIPAIIFGTMVSIFSLILKVVESLNRYRERILNLSEQGYALTPKQRRYLLEKKFFWLFIGITLVLTGVSFAMVLVPAFFPNPGYFERFYCYLTGFCLLFATYSILKTSYLDYQAMKRILDKQPPPD